MSIPLGPSRKGVFVSRAISITSTTPTIAMVFLSRLGLITRPSNNAELSASENYQGEYPRSAVVRANHIRYRLLATAYSSGHYRTRGHILLCNIRSNI